MDVPWVTSWTAEPMIGVAPCPTVDGALAIVQTERPGYGKPVYSQNHMQRQRASVRDMLCPMCGEPTVAGDRWTVLAKRRTAGGLRKSGMDRFVAEEVPDDQPVLDAGSIAPLHRACADRSLRLCPHLKGSPAAELMPFPEKSTVTPLLVRATAPLEHFRRTPAGQAATVLVTAFLQLCGIG